MVGPQVDQDIGARGLRLFRTRGHRTWAQANLQGGHTLLSLCGGILRGMLLSQGLDLSINAHFTPRHGHFDIYGLCGQFMRKLSQVGVCSLFDFLRCVALLAQDHLSGGAHGQSA